MKKTLRLLAVIIPLAALVFWAVMGSNRGWTKNKVETKFVDEVTGLEGRKYEDGFIPGLDFLGLAVLGSGILVGISFFCRDKKSN